MPATVHSVSPALKPIHDKIIKGTYRSEVVKDEYIVGSIQSAKQDLYGHQLARISIRLRGAPTNPGLARQCEDGLKVAFAELDISKANGFSGTIDWTKVDPWVQTKTHLV